MRQCTTFYKTKIHPSLKHFPVCLLSAFSLFSEYILLAFTRKPIKPLWQRYVIKERNVAEPQQMQLIFRESSPLCCIFHFFLYKMGYFILILLRKCRERVTL